MDVNQLRQDVVDGTIDVDRLVDLVDSQRKVIQPQQARIDELNAQVEELKKKNPTDRLDEAFSEKAEEKRQAKAKGKRRKKKPPKRRGRLSTSEKIAPGHRGRKGSIPTAVIPRGPDMVSPFRGKNGDLLSSLASN